MALSTAQRQRRYRERLKARANGVTPEMIVRAARLQFDPGDPEISWDELMRRAQRSWILFGQLLPDDPDATYEEFGADAEMMRAVARVVNAVLVPPSPSQHAAK